MPIYEYICLDCKQEYEILRSFNESDQPLHCDKCDSDNVKRKLSVFYAQSGGSTISGTSGGCSSCGGGDCGSCGI